MSKQCCPSGGGGGRALSGSNVNDSAVESGEMEPVNSANGCKFREQKRDSRSSAAIRAPLHV